ncbi:MAG: TonB family protein [Prevotella sp.]|nr:TonB family protein [Prevotella sp.]
MKECPNCKSVMDDDALFCGVCGTKFEIEEVEAPVEEPVATEEKYCIHCGKAIETDSMFCPFCGKPQEVKEEKNEEPQPKPAEPEPQLEPEKPEPQPITAEPEPQQEPEKPEPKPEETEQTQTEEQKTAAPTQTEQPEQPKPSEQPQAEETYEGEEKKKSKTLLWLLLAALIISGAAWYYLLSGSDSDSYPAVEGDYINEPIDTVPEDFEEESEMTSGALAFLEDFYKGKHLIEQNIPQYVTANVLNKLKRDYEYDCPSDDCLAAWVFTAYPAGADLDLEEGPIFSSTDIDGRYKVDFKYSFYNGEQKGYETRTVYLTVTEMDGKYLISDYEVVEDAGEIEQEQETQEIQENDMQSQKVDPQVKSAVEFRSGDIKESEPPKTEDTNVYDQVEQMPQFPGGQAALIQYLAKNIKYPVAAEENGIQGKVVVSFIVERDGTISNVKIAKSVDPSLDREALRVVKSMPRWQPGKQKGANVRVKYTAPVNFSL